jgi:hypothetical protein
MMLREVVTARAFTHPASACLQLGAMYLVTQMPFHARFHDAGARIAASRARHIVKE